jgi:hypothetical protein
MRDIHIRITPEEEEFIQAMEYSPSKIFHDAVLKLNYLMWGTIELFIEHEGFERWPDLGKWVEWWLAIGDD